MAVTEYGYSMICASGNTANAPVMRCVVRGELNGSVAVKPSKGERMQLPVRHKDAQIFGIVVDVIHAPALWPQGTHHFTVVVQIMPKDLETLFRDIAPNSSGLWHALAETDWIMKLVPPELRGSAPA